MGVMGAPEVRGSRKTEAVMKNVMGAAGALEAGQAVLICSLLFLAVVVLLPWPLLRAHAVSEAVVAAWLDRKLAVAFAWDAHFRT